MSRFWASVGSFFARFSRGGRADRDMTEGSVWKHLIGFAAPLAVGLLFQQMYNTVDTVIVGRYVSEDALAAVGSTTNIINMLIALCMGLSTGTSVVISQRYGAHDNEKMKEAVHTAMSVTFILCAIATVVGLLLVDPMLKLMDTPYPSAVYDDAKTYLTVYIAGISGLFIYNMGAAILRAVGDSRRPLYFLICSACLNVAGDLVFVLLFDLGVLGVALATILSQFCSAILVLIVLSRTDGAYGLRLRELRLQKDMLKKIFSLGLPAGIQQAITSFSNIFVLSYIYAFGESCMAGWTAYSRIDAFILIPVQSLALASTTFVGQNCGTNNYRRARRGIISALLLSVGITALLAGIVMLCREPLLYLFNDDLEMLTAESDFLKYGSYFILVISPFYVTLCINQIFAGALRGIGQAKIPMVIMLGSFVLFRQLVLLLNQNLFGGEILGVSLAYPAGWILCSLLLSIAFAKSRLCRDSVLR